MKRAIVLPSSLVLAALASGCAAAPESPAATTSPTPTSRVETIHVHGVRSLDDISSTTAWVSDRPAHEIGQRVYAYRLSSPAKDFDGAQAMNFAQTDSIAGAGTHHGYALRRLSNGASVTIEFEGRHAARGSEPGAADPTNGGTLRFTGGTGKYRNAHVTSTYTGVVGTREASFDCDCRIEY
ncbi:MAG: hypothetical protein ACTHK2_14615 [Dokdonella sp.]|uniref:hypothetical protein n=1 Tax=Dokdonella sp. TaxID=2291710 RepID=UPI003F7FEB96